MKLKEKVALVTGGSRGQLDARGVFGAWRGASALATTLLPEHPVPGASRGTIEQLFVVSMKRN